MWKFFATDSQIEMQSVIIIMIIKNPRSIEWIDRTRMTQIVMIDYDLRHFQISTFIKSQFKIPRH